MKYSLALIAISLMFSACTNEPESVVESEWTPEQPKLVAFFLEENDVKFKQSEEKYYEDGAMEYSGSYDIEGNRHGEWKYYYTNGNIWSVGNYANGAKTGVKQVYWPEGKMRYEGFFTDDLKSGHWKFYDKDGSLIEEMDY